MSFPWNVNKNLPHNKSWDKIKQTQYLLAQKKSPVQQTFTLRLLFMWCLAALNWTFRVFISLSSMYKVGVFLGHSGYWIQYFSYLTQSLVRIPSINSYVFITVIFYWNIFELLKSLSPSLSVLLRNSFVFSSNFKWDPLRIKSTS